MENDRFNRAMSRITAGDTSGLEEIYRAYASSVYAVCLSVTGRPADAEDAAVETFLRIWQKAGTYRPGAEHRAWLMTIAHHTAAEIMRRQNRISPVEDTVLEVFPSQDRLEDEACTRLFLEWSLEQMSETERQVVSLHLIADLPLREVARILGEPLGTVAWRNRQAMGKLRRMMKEREEMDYETTV